jgi:hypothetical protein
LAKPKSVGSCEGIDLTPCGCHLHLSTISSRRSSRRGRSFFPPNNSPPGDPTNWKSWCLVFLISSLGQPKFPCGWMILVHGNFGHLSELQATGVCSGAQSRRSRASQIISEQHQKSRLLYSREAMGPYITFTQHRPPCSFSGKPRGLID